MLTGGDGAEESGLPARAASNTGATCLNDAESFRDSPFTIGMASFTRGWKLCKKQWSGLSFAQSTALVRHYSALPIHGSPLSGVRVLDFTEGHAGPLSTMLLGDLGADVIKVENPMGGDRSREWGTKVPALDSTSSSESAFFLAVNRNKRSLTLNVEDKSDLEIVSKIIPKCDVMVTDWTAQRAESLGLHFGGAVPRNNKLVYCSVTGYGQTGPYKDIVSQDGVMCAETGLTYCTGEPDRAPTRPQIAPTDYAAAYYAYGAVMAALLSRDLTGEPVYIDVAALDSQIASMGNVGGAYLNGNMEYTRVGTAHPTVVPYEVFATSDGCLMIGAGNNSQFDRFAEAIGRPDLSKNPLFCTNPLRVSNRLILVPILVDILAGNPTQYWQSKFNGKGEDFRLERKYLVQAGKTFAHPQVEARGIITESKHTTLGKIKSVSPAVMYNGARMKIRYPPPTLGEHTEELLEELLN